MFYDIFFSFDIIYRFGHNTQKYNQTIGSYVMLLLYFGIIKTFDFSITKVINNNKLLLL